MRGRKLVFRPGHHCVCAKQACVNGFRRRIGQPGDYNLWLLACNISGEQRPNAGGTSVLIRRFLLYGVVIALAVIKSYIMHRIRTEPN